MLSLGDMLIGQQVVSGVITDASNGDALIGVNILEKGTTVGTTTDIDGNYTLTLATPNPTLEISYVGYKTVEISVDARSNIDILMEEDANQLDEVVVIGYGTQKKKVVTGAIAKVDGQDLEDMQVTRLEGALQGRTTGVTVINDSGQPGSGATIRVRGVTGFGGGSPLYVVDGVVINGGIDYLNPGDIESIEVLKDGASTSIYGTRASGGVILVTTKTGKKGTHVNYNGFYGTQRPWRKLSLLNGTEYATLRNESSVAAGRGIQFENPQQYGEGTDWQDAVFRYDAPYQQHELNFSGGGEKSDYYTSFSYYNAQGIVSDDDSRYERYNVRLNNNYQLFDDLKVGSTIAYSRVQATGVATNSEFGSPLSRAINLDPITPLFETDEDELAKPIYAANQVVTNDEGQVYGISPYVTSEVLNPVAAFEVNQGYGWSDKIVASLFGDYSITEHLTYGAKLGADLAFWGGEGFAPIYYLNATNRNDITAYNRSQNRGLSYILSNTLTYERTFNKHKVTALVGASAEKNKGRGQGGTITNLPITSIEDASFGFGSTPDDQTFFGFEYENRLNSLFGRLTYNFSEKYLFMASVRRDGSSRFGPNRKFGVFPGVSVGWIVSEEDFISGDSFLNFLKLRASYGVNGTDNIGDFRYLPLVFTGSNYSLGVDDILTIGASPGSLSNPDLRWEETSQTNFGFDATVFEHFTITADVYSKKVTGILRPLDVPGFVGFGSPDGNIGKIDNRGIELELGYGKTVNRTFNFDISGNIAYTENEIIFISDGVEFLPGQRFGPQGLEITRAILGQPIEQFFGYKTDGIFQTQEEVDNYVNADGMPLLPDAAPGDLRFLDIDGDGDVDPEDRTTLGDPTPTWSYGVNLTAEYGNFDFTLFGQGVFGNEIYDATRRYDLVGSNLPGTALGRWTGEGTSTTFPRLIDSDPNRNFTRSSDFFVESGAYFRIKNLQIGYKIPAHAAAKMGIGKARFYFSANNVVTITNYSGFDPEIPGGVDRGIYPQARSLVFGANITFK